jgi:PD-(D/E)XK nuclease superfamily
LKDKKMDVAVEPKNFSWSYSRLKAFEDCPRRYHETQVKKAWPEEKSEMLEFGDAVHDAMATALRTGEPLPTKFKIYQRWIDSLLETEGELLIENDCQWAITRDFKPTAWFAKDVWLRCIADAVKLDYRNNPKPAALVVDWKAGKSANGDPIQLTLTSLMMFIQFPQIRSVRADFVWLQENDRTQQSLYRHEAADAWADLMPRVEKLQQATNANYFPPKPNRFCRSWCPVKSCEYHGR